MSNYRYQKQLLQLFSNTGIHTLNQVYQRRSYKIIKSVQENYLQINCKLFYSSVCKSSALNCRPVDYVEKMNEDNVYINDKQKQQDFVITEVRLNKLYSKEESQNMKNELLETGTYLNEINFDSIFLNICAIEGCFEAGRSYFQSIYAPGKCSIATIGKFFRLCHACKEKCSKEDQDFIVNLYHELIERYQTLDPITCENAALALSITDKWSECLKLLKMCSETTSPPSKMYSEIIIASFTNNDINLGWELMKEAAQHLKKLSIEVYECWLRISEYKEDSFNQLFQFFSDFHLQLTQDEALRLIELFKKLSQKSCISFVRPSGKCVNCNSTLNQINLTAEEFSKLRNFFLDPVLIGKNIFAKTKPSELKSYIDFINSVGKVDVVLDGLNIAYSGTKKKNPKYMSFMLERVVEHFVRQKKKVIVFGRQHLANLNAFRYIKNNAHFFLTEDLSSDDPFLLYATMYSGYGTYFLSRDQMRGHKFLLKERELRLIFSKWQQKFQYHLTTVTNEGKVIIKEPLPYEIKAQKNRSGVWHIPVATDITNTPGHLKTVKSQWICLP